MPPRCIGHNGGVSDLIDTTEMYLRTVYELQEEGIPALRARIAERLGQSGPTVSQTVARMERDGLLTVSDDRRIVLTESGELQATRVMRKHRLAERLLVDIIGLDWESVHDEACRWEHVISDEVERRLVALLDGPTESPFGNPIPGLAELDTTLPTAHPTHGVSLNELAQTQPQQVRIVRITEALQEEPEVMRALSSIDLLPNRVFTLSRTDTDIQLVGPTASIALSPEHAGGIIGAL